MRAGNPVRSLWHAVQDYKSRAKQSYNNQIEQCEVMLFQQTWGSGSCGFGGMGVAAITKADTVVIRPASSDTFYVYIAERFAYSVRKNEVFMRDLESRYLCPATNARTLYDVVEDFTDVRKEKHGKS